ncbi:lysosomal pro-x carboxypeptidase [Quercus suber]|uniref:Lysosomal pro-x carboxypeptidase n=1 Tax=Quercus suber TaxID=58331 RepID=A0AAW0K3L2_QUESU
MDTLRSFHLLILVFTFSASAFAFNMPRLGTLPITMQHEPQTISSISHPEDFKTYYYNQKLDHFNYRLDSYTTFKQRYVINYRYWGGANASAPIFAYLGAEFPLDEEFPNIGFLSDNAPKSVPYGSMKAALKNESIRGYFNSAQAIADYAAVLLHIKKNLSAENSPIIVIGGSYGGMLAAWFRLKYPHIALGAIASSAPILYFDTIAPQAGYFSIVTKDFKEYLVTIYSDAAQYNHPPSYPLSILCNAIDGASVGTDTVGRIYAGVVAYMGNHACYDVNVFKRPTETSEGWNWQTCSEMVMPIGFGTSPDSMFPPQTFNLNEFINECKSFYGVLPQPHWVTTYYGGQDLKLTLHRFGSNIIFSNGLRDPYSSGGVLENISENVLAVTTINGSHCLDILLARPSDPQWLVMQRKTEVKIIEQWIAKYREDLLAFKLHVERERERVVPKGENNASSNLCSPFTNNHVMIL